MRSKVFGVCALAGVAWASGCGSSEPNRETASTTASAIQGGSTDTTHNFAVGVYNQAYSAICSGALLAPNLVITARHCVSQTPQSIDCSTAHFGSQVSAGSVSVTTNYNMNSSGYVSASKIITPTPTGVCGNDLAILILTMPIKLSQYVTPISDMTDHNTYSTTETAIGYGIDAPNDQNSAGIRRIRQNIQIQCIPGDPQLDCGSGSSKWIAPQEFYSGDGTCEGDSGSSAYEQTFFNQGTPMSFGVLSRGGTQGNTCVGGIYTRLDSWWSLLVSAALEAAQKGNYPPPSWTGSAPPPQDAGKPQPDSGGSGNDGAAPPPPGADGAPCNDPSDCDSGNCVSLDGNGYVCASACGDGNKCAPGFVCKSGFCFQGSDDAGSKPQATPTNVSQGCEVAPIGRADPSKPIPWRWALAAFGIAALVRRRRARSS